MDWENKLTKVECLAILDKWQHWNTAQKSMSLSWGGSRTAEDDIFDARRELILKTTKRLIELT